MIGRIYKTVISWCGILLSLRLVDDYRMIVQWSLYDHWDIDVTRFYKPILMPPCTYCVFKSLSESHYFSNMVWKHLERIQKAFQRHFRCIPKAFEKPSEPFANTVQNASRWHLDCFQTSFKLFRNQFSNAWSPACAATKGLGANSLRLSVEQPEFGEVGPTFIVPLDPAAAILKKIPCTPKKCHNILITYLTSATSWLCRQ